jgi:hypothetical protein
LWAKYWLRVLTEIKNRGIRDVLMVVCDGLKGLPDAIAQVWPQAVTQTCIVHLVRNSFRYASRRDWDAVAKALRPAYTASSESAALDAFAEFSGHWEAKYPAIVKLWESAWAEFVPFLRFDQEIRTLICTTNAIVIDECPVPPLGQSPRPHNDRAGRPQAPLPRHHQPRPHRARQAAVEQPVESRIERLRHHL